MKRCLPKLLVALCCAVTLSAQAQVTSKGTDFWAVFPATIFEPADLSLMISGTAATTVTVSAPGFTTTVPVTPGQVTTVSLPLGVGTVLMKSNDQITSQGVHIVSGQPVSVSAFYNNSGSSESFLIYPTAMLGTNYCLVAYPTQFPHQPPFPATETEFAIVATANNTTVTIDPSAQANLPNRPAPFIITLQQGQTYQMSNSATIYDLPGPLASHPSDVTGTSIRSDKPVAVVAGAVTAYVPGVACCANPLLESQVPVAYWGTQAFGVPLQHPTVFRVVAAYDKTDVFTNGVFMATLQAGQFVDASFEDAVQFRGTRPIQVAQIGLSGGGLSDHDPFMALLMPTNQWLQSYTVSIPAGTVAPIDSSYIELIVRQPAIPNTLVDGQLASSLGTFTAIGTSGFSSAHIARTDGAHTVSSSEPVGVRVYGFGTDDGYGYIAGTQKPALAAVPDYRNIGLNSSLIIDVLGNDIFANRNNVTVTIVSGPTLGSASVTGSKNISYQSFGTSGDDQLTYQISEGGNSSTAVVTVRINNHAPVAADDFAPSPTQTDIGVTIPVLDNDTDPDGDPLRLLYVGTPSHGRAIGNNDNTITYMRTNADQISDSFTYTITDSRGGTATATVHITVPKPVISVTLEGPPDIYKGVDGLGIPVGGYTWFVFRRTGPTTSPMFFTFFLGGDGTAQYPFPYPAYAKYPEDFDEVTGANKAPFPNGFYFTFPVGVSEMTIGVQTVHDETVPEDPYMYQDLLCTVPDVGVNGPYDPDPNAWQGHAFIHPYPYWW